MFEIYGGPLVGVRTYLWSCWQGGPCTSAPAAACPIIGGRLSQPKICVRDRGRSATMDGPFVWWNAHLGSHAHIEGFGIRMYSRVE